jgi:hypothetical protein
MRKTVFAILATTALLSTGMLATRVEAMTAAPLGVAAPNTDLVQQAAVVCGPRGCVRRPTPIRPAPIRRPKYLEWMPTRLDETGWKMRALQMGWFGLQNGMVRQVANLLPKYKARRIAAKAAGAVA